MKRWRSVCDNNVIYNNQTLGCLGTNYCIPATVLKGLTWKVTSLFVGGPHTLLHDVIQAA